jgi:hypothetical protein
MLARRPQGVPLPRVAAASGGKGRETERERGGRNVDERQAREGDAEEEEREARAGVGRERRRRAAGGAREDGEENANFFSRG